MQLRVTGKHLLVGEVVPIKSQGGIMFPETAREHHRHDTGAKLYDVLQVGPAVTEPIRTGDRVLCLSFTEGAIPVCGINQQIITESQVILNLADHR